MIHFDDLPPEIGFLFLSIGQAAVSASQRGIPKEFFVEFCSEMWETMEMNGVDEFGKIIMGTLGKDIDRRMGDGTHDTIQSMINKKNRQ